MGNDAPHPALPQPAPAPAVTTDNPVPQWSPSNEPTPPLLGGPLAADSNPGKVTAVDTASLTAYAGYLDSLIPGVETARSDLENVDVQPGAFYDADTMRTKINGSGGLSGQYVLMLGDLTNGLTSIKQGLLEMATKYTDTESLNKMSATDLENEFNTAQQYFGNMMSDGGGSGIPNSPGGLNNTPNSNTPNTPNTSSNSNNT